MRRSFSLPRLAIVVVWAALAPQSRWTELFPQAIVPADSTPSQLAECWNPAAWVSGSDTTDDCDERGRATLALAEQQYDAATGLGDWRIDEADGTDGLCQESIIDYLAMKEASTAYSYSPSLYAPGLCWSDCSNTTVRFDEAQTFQPLAQQQVDAATGVIHWPAVLTQNQFDLVRQGLETLWAERDSATDSGPQIRWAVRQLEHTLRGSIGNIPPTEYITARKFLTSLEVEAGASQKPNTHQESLPPMQT